MGMPIHVETTNRQAALISTLRHDFSKMTKAIVEAPIATKGVATCIPTTKANRGIAISASPKPNAERTNVEKKMMTNTKIVEVVESMRFTLVISNKITCSCSSRSPRRRGRRYERWSDYLQYLKYPIAFSAPSPAQQKKSTAPLTPNER